MRRMPRRLAVMGLWGLMTVGLGTVRPEVAWSAELTVGAASVSITPDEPVALSGQMHTRISKKVETPVTANALAVEAKDGQKVAAQAIFVSCDLVAIREGVLEAVRERLKDRIPDFDTSKIVLNATHTHTAPVMLEGRYEIPKEGVMQPSEYFDFLADRVADAASRAWKGREPGRVGWGLGHAVVAQNRRAVYADGHAQMYGKTDKPDFRGIEGYEDHGVEVLCFWDKDNKLIATAVNLACPSQEVESRSAVNADFWHPVRERLQEKHGKNLVVLGWAGAAGDQSPHLMFRKDAEERMRKLRGIDRLDELALRIVSAWEEAYEGAKMDIHDNVPMAHQVKTIGLPIRLVTDSELEEATQQVKTLSKDPSQKRRMLWHKSVLTRYKNQKAGEVGPLPMELHVIRLGDIAIATNRFELFTEYGIQMKARSRALQTFVIQLAGPGSYLPTADAVRGGGYSAIIQSNAVGPEGGQELVEQTVKTINALWPEP